MKEKNKPETNGTRWTQVVVSCYFWFTLFFISGFLFPVSLSIWIVTVLFDRRRILCHKFTYLWSDIILGVNPYWKVTVEGRDKIAPNGTYIMVSNHQSGADILVLFKLHRHFKWVAKKGLFLVPFIGWNMWLNGYIPVERSRGRSKLRMMDRAAGSLRKGNSVIFFPEGTRTRDGNLQPYKTGAFRLAVETGTPVLPVVIRGTFRAIKKGGFLISKNPGLKLVVLNPVMPDEFQGLDPKELANLVRERTRAELEK